jgi:hypothetical protein
MSTRKTETTIVQPKGKNLPSTLRPAESCLTVLPKPSRTRYWSAPADEARPAGDEAPGVKRSK